MAIRIRRLHPSFVGEVSGIDITRALSCDEVEAIEAGMAEHAVLVFRGSALQRLITSPLIAGRADPPAMRL